MNVTVPHKAAAAGLAQRCSPAVILAGAANTLCWADGGWEAHNTDGLGLISDFGGFGLVSGGPALGSGGGRRCCGGVIAPLLAEEPEQLVILNRTEARADELSQSFQKCSRSQQARRWRAQYPSCL